MKSVLWNDKLASVFAWMTSSDCPSDLQAWQMSYRVGFCSGGSAYQRRVNANNGVPARRQCKCKVWGGTTTNFQDTTMLNSVELANNERKCPAERNGNCRNWLHLWGAAKALKREKCNIELQWPSQRTDRRRSKETALTIDKAVLPAKKQNKTKRKFVCQGS
jgi:hypothetical protein